MTHHSHGIFGSKKEKEKEIVIEDKAPEPEKEQDPTKQPHIIKSYNDLLLRKKKEEEQQKIDQYLKVILERANRLKVQGDTAADRLGKTGDYYSDVWQAIKSESPAFLHGDKAKHCELLELLASDDSETTSNEIIMQELYEHFPEIADWT